MDKIRKQIRPCIIQFHKVSKMKSWKEFYLKMFQLHMLRKDEHVLKYVNGNYSWSQSLSGQIYMKFDDPNSGNKLKDGHYPGKLRQCLPLFAKCKAFPFSKARTAIMLSQSS